MYRRRPVYCFTGMPSAIFALLVLLLWPNLLPAQKPGDKQALAELRAQINQFYDDINAAVGAPAPDLQFTNIDNRQPQTLAGLRGKTVLLKFWAVGCGPCVAEIPTIKKLQEEVDPNSLVILYLSGDSLKLQQQFLAKTELPGLKAILAPGDLKAIYDNSFVPRTILIDSLGIIRAGWLGSITYDKLQDNLKLAEQALSQN